MMFVRFSYLGIKYITILANGGFISLDELLHYSAAIFEIPGGNTKNFAAAFLSPRLNLNIAADMISVIPKDEAQLFMKDNQENK